MPERSKAVAYITQVVKRFPRLRRVLVRLAKPHMDADLERRLSDPQTRKQLWNVLREEKFMDALRDETGLLHRVLRHPGIAEAVTSVDDEFTRRRLPALLSFAAVLRWLSPMSEEATAHDPDRLSSARALIQHEGDLRKAVMTVIDQDNLLHLRTGTLKIPDEYSFWVQLHELFETEDYYFETDTDAPYIIDGGVHMGLSIYYFKTLFPGATVVGFEPMPALRELAQENVLACGFQDVSILPYALAAEDGVAKFHVHSNDTMAGTLTGRRREEDMEGETFDVECRRLSSYIDRPVHFVKLDIEGPEDEVLAEAEDRLQLVQHIFCEYHHGAGLATNRLARILDILDRAQFDVQVGKSYGYRLKSLHRPMMHVHEPYSAVIWARNRAWPPRVQ